MRILVVEDDADLAEALADALQAQGHEALVARDGVAALASLSGAAPPDLALLDLLLPGITGWEVLSRLADGGGLPCPIVVLSTIADAAPIGVPALQKPVSLQRLLSVIDRCVTPPLVRPSLSA